VTRETPHGTHGTPAWLGEYEPVDLEPGDLGPGDREPVPPDGLPLWPSEARTEPITVSYVEPAWTGREREPDGMDGTGLGTLGLVTVTGRRPTRPPAAPRRGSHASRRRPRQAAAPGLAALVLLAVLSAFFAWVTAEPLWLALGHSTAGTVTVTRCVDHGVNRRCAGTFTSADGRFTRTSVPVMGDTPAAGAGVDAGERVSAPARMTSARGHRAYVDVDAGSRAAIGVALVVLCAMAIVRATGVRRLPKRHFRVVASLVALAGPLSLLAAMLAATF
jgi:hypothetical protein